MDQRFATQAEFNSRPAALTSAELGTDEAARVAKAQNQYGNACALASRIIGGSMVGNDDTDYTVLVGGHAESTPVGDTIYVSVCSQARPRD